MTEINKEKYLAVARKVAKEAGEYLLRNFGEVKMMTHKHDGHFGIEDDKVTNSIYEKLLKKSTPEVGLYTEEGRRDTSKELTWVIDPLEGTSNYRVGIPFFATQICLLKSKDPLISVIIAPKLSQEFYATKGGGTFLNGKKVSVSKLSNLSKALINIGKGTKHKDNIWYAKTVSKFLSHVRTIRSLGSCGLELAYCASGKIDAVIYNGAQPYDYATGVLLIREGGGTIVNEGGKDWQFGDRYLLVSNKNLVPKLHKILQNTK